MFFAGKNPIFSKNGIPSFRYYSSVFRHDFSEYPVLDEVDRSEFESPVIERFEKVERPIFIFDECHYTKPFKYFLLENEELLNFFGRRQSFDFFSNLIHEALVCLNHTMLLILLDERSIFDFNFLAGQPLARFFPNFLFENHASCVILVSKPRNRVPVSLLIIFIRLQFRLSV